MRELLNYPFDASKIMLKRKAIKKSLIDSGSNFLEKKIAILGGSTTHDIIEILEIFLLYYGIRPIFYESEYGKYWEDGMFGNPELDSFEPDIVYIHTNWRNIIHFPDINDSEDVVSQKLNLEFNRFVSLWRAVEERFHCPIIQNNFDRPNYRLMGNRDIWDYRGRSNYISKLNQLLYGYAQKHQGFYINDLEYLSQDYGLSEWGNSLYWYMYKYAMCLNAIPYVAHSVSNIIKSIYGKNRKALVLDLDNTLWGGIVGDDGVEGIKVGPEISNGQVYTEFQNYCKQLKDIGVILAINSKNEMENALAGLMHPDGILRPDDFVDIKANWEPKDQNIREIAEELTLGVESFVFVDDNPVEREIVTSQIPEVAVPMVGKPENYISIIEHCGFFEVTTLSNEDLKKTEMYHAKAEAFKAVSKYSNYGEYLESLNMTAVIDDFKAIYIQRIAQLTNKSNQFNLTTLRCSEEDIKNMQESSDYICLCGKLCDKFADNGLVSVVIGEKSNKELHLRLWLMSCRVLKREMEDAMMNAIVEMASKQGIRKIIGYYYPTSKNGMVRTFYENMGFIFEDEDSAGNTIWSIDIEHYKKKSLHMNVELLV